MNQKEWDKLVDDLFALDEQHPYLDQMEEAQEDGVYEDFLRLILRKYDPNQPRAPKGSSDGGQWVREGGGESMPTVEIKQPSGVSVPSNVETHTITDEVLTHEQAKAEVFAHEKDTGNEMLVVTTTDGKTIRNWGTEDGVELTRNIDHMLKGATLVHNHPNNSPLSAADLFSASRTQMARVYAVGKDGSEFLAVPNPAHPPLIYPLTQSFADHMASGQALEIMFTRPEGADFLNGEAAGYLFQHTYLTALKKAGFLLEYEVKPGTYLTYYMEKFDWFDVDKRAEELAEAFDTDEFTVEAEKVLAEMEEKMKTEDKS